ncbi:MAG: SIS domain-containing protein, partial [Candidatus Thermoplasmatota archaeon]|nr:SIS domain-containing protein [Candidatus Thermoplasmatota archaeon]
KPIIIRSLDDPKMDIVQDSVRKYAEPYVLNAPGSNPLSRIMGSIFILDMASVYVALLSGNDPTPVEAIMDLKASCQHLGPGP